MVTQNPKGSDNKKKQPQKGKGSIRTFVPTEDKPASTPQGWPHREGCEPYGRSIETVFKFTLIINMFHVPFT